MGRQRVPEESVGLDELPALQGFPDDDLQVFRVEGLWEEIVGPLFMASTAISMDPWAVMTMTGRSIPSRRRVRSSSMPPIRGIWRSSSINAGTSCWMRDRASCPSAAMATSHSIARSRTSRSRREAASSSTIRTRAPVMSVIVSQPHKSCMDDSPGFELSAWTQTQRP